MRGPTSYSTLNRATTMREAAGRPRGKGRLEGGVWNGGRGHTHDMKRWEGREGMIRGGRREFD